MHNKNQKHFSENWIKTILAPKISTKIQEMQ